MVCGAAMLDEVKFLGDYFSVILPHTATDCLSYNKEHTTLRMASQSDKRQSLTITYALSSSFTGFLVPKNLCFFNHVQDLILLLRLNKH